LIAGQRGVILIDQVLIKKLTNRVDS